MTFHIWVSDLSMHN